MGFHAYLISDFDNVHENIFFYEVARKLNNQYEKTAGRHILIGNISCNGYQIDALFIRSKQITVIDFKDYGGKLSFSENNPWQIISDGKPIFVYGGKSNRNPFRQVQAYRRALIDLLGKKEGEIIIGARTKLNWGHISSHILFHKNIEFNYHTLPKLTQYYFSIGDKRNFIEKLKGQVSNELVFTDNEIQNILSVLDVKEVNRLADLNIETDINRINENNPGARILQQLVRLEGDASNYKRILEYYRVIVEFERYRGSRSLGNFSYRFDKLPDSSRIEVDLKSNKLFHDRLVVNHNETYPKNIYASLEIIVGGSARNLFVLNIAQKEIDINNDFIEIELNSFDLNIDELKQMIKEEDIADELILEISKSNSIEEKLQLIENSTGSKTMLSGILKLGLTSEEGFTNNLINELVKLSQIDPKNYKNTLFDFFLDSSKSLIKRSSNKEDLIQITELNEGQKQAVESALRERLSVITGPPGSGKTQVILNLLANALVYDKKVLFASQNNKAIDNVVERFHKISIDYSLVRFGNQGENTVTIPKITEILNKVEGGEIVGADKEYDSLLKFKNQNLKEQNKIKNAFKKYEYQVTKRKGIEIEFRILNSPGSDLYEKYYNSRNELEESNEYKKEEFSKYFSENFDKLLFISNNTIVKSVYLKILKIRRENIKRKVEKLSFDFNQQTSEYNNLVKKYIEISQKLLQIKIRNNYSKIKSSIVRQYLNSIPVYNANRDEEKRLKSNIFSFLSYFPLVSVTNLSVRNVFLLEQVFDLLIIDEASQCDIASMIPLLYRAKNVVIIGDPLQLKHISKMSDFEAAFLSNYLKLDNKVPNVANKSFYDYGASVISNVPAQPVFLEEHFRSHPEIIKFSSDNFYLRELGKSLTIKTNPANFVTEELGVFWIDTHGEINNTTNINVVEIDKCCELARQKNTQYPDLSIGIITPFANIRYQVI